MSRCPNAIQIRAEVYLEMPRRQGEYFVLKSLGLQDFAAFGPSLTSESLIAALRQAGDVTSFLRLPAIDETPIVEPGPREAVLRNKGTVIAPCPLQLKRERLMAEDEVGKSPRQQQLD
jgi:hypothetical protein